MARVTMMELVRTKQSNLAAPSARSLSGGLVCAEVRRRQAEALRRAAKRKK